MRVPLEAWEAARDERQVILDTLLDDTPLETVLEIARDHVRRFPRCPPDAFLWTTSKAANAADLAFKGGDGWLWKMWHLLETPTHFTLHAYHLGLSPEDADSAKLYDESTLDRWRAAVRHNFKGPFRAKIEASSSRIHVHIVADLYDGPRDRRIARWQGKRTRVARIIQDVKHLEKLAAYLSKPASKFTAEALATWLKAKATMPRLPRLPFWRGIPKAFPTVSKRRPKEEVEGVPSNLRSFKVDEAKSTSIDETPASISRPSKPRRSTRGYARLPSFFESFDLFKRKISTFAGFSKRQRHVHARESPSPFRLPPRERGPPSSSIAYHPKASFDRRDLCKTNSLNASKTSIRPAKV